jgi:hypothetical protein
MRTKDIRTTSAGVDFSCDVCGRTLLRGERAHPYIDGDTARVVCELCTARAENEGWLPEGVVPAYDDSASQRDRRGSLFGRWRRRRDARPQTADSLFESEPPAHAGVVDPPGPAMPPPSLTAPAPEPSRRSFREARNVRAIPTSAENRIAFAIDAFNASEHPPTVAGIARSLGLPQVSVRPLADHPSVVGLVLGWELCWYRYEFDLADEDGGVRLAGQGQELDELPRIEREPNAVCDDRGFLAAA